MKRTSSYEEYEYSSSTYDSNASYYGLTRNGDYAPVYRSYGRWYWTDYYGEYTGQVYRGHTRLEDTIEAANQLVDALLANNKDETQGGVSLKDVVEISVVKFANKEEESGTDWYGNHYYYNGTETLISKSTDAEAIKGVISSLTPGGGTHWEAALQEAKKEADTKYKSETDQSTSVIFLTDGVPTMWGDDDEGGEENAENTHAAWNAASDDARAIVSPGNYTLYNIFAFGTDKTKYDWDGGRTDADYLRALTNYAYSGTGTYANTTLSNKAKDYFFNASDTSALQEAFEAIIDKINNTVGYGGVTVDDGVTVGVTNTSVTVDGSVNTDSFKYTVKDGDDVVYTVKIHDNKATFTIDGEEYTVAGEQKTETIHGTPHTNTVYSVTVGDKTYKMSPASMDNKGEVKWDLACIGTLENGYTYTLSFDVWPNQAAYDAVADLNNGLKTIDEVPESVSSYLVYKDGKYHINTNYQQSVDYYTVKTEEKEGQEPVTTYSEKYTKELGPIDPVLLTSSEMDFRKHWKDNLDKTQRQRYLYDEQGNSRKIKITLHVWKAETIKELEKQIADYSGTPEQASANDYMEKVLGWNGTDYDWDDSLEVAPGTMILKSKAEEMGIDSSKHQVVTYEGKKYVVLEKGHYYTVTEDNIDSHYELNTIVYHPMLVDGELSNVTFNNDGTVEKIVPMSEVAATNVLRGGININKKVIGDNNEELNYDGTFDMKVTLNAPKDKDGKPDLTNLEKYDGKTVAWYRYYEGKTAIKDESKLDFAGTADREGTFYWRDGWYYIVFDNSGKAEGTIKVNTKYTVRFTNMAAGTSYDLVETETNGMTPSYAFTHKDADEAETSDPAGEPHTVVANQENNISVTNTATLDPDKVIGPSFTIHKKDDSGNNMSGVEFTLTGKQSTGAAYSKKYSTDANGQILVDFEGFNFGTNGKEKYTFTLHEKTPDGHAGAGDWTINVKEDDETYTLTKVAEKENVFQKVWKWVINALTGTSAGNGTTEGSSTWNEETKVLEVINPVNVFDLTVVKTFSGIDKTEVPKDAFKINLDYKDTELKIDNNTVVSDDGLTFTWTVKDVPFGTKVKATENKPAIPGYEYDANNKSAKDEDETTITVPEEGKEYNTLKLNNPYKKKGYGLKVVKKFVGLENTDALADGYAISVKYGDSEKTLKLNSEGVQKEGMTYTWTVDNIPFKSSVTVKETGYDLAAYTEDTAVEVKNVANGKTNATEATFDMPANDAAQAEADFTNTYFRTPVTLKVEKKFDSWEKAAEFKFDITAKTAGAPMPDPTTVTATEKNPVQSFSELVFTEAKTYEYTIKEQNLHADGVTYDENEHKVVVKVEKKNSNSNELKATVTYDGEEVDKLTVTNTYKALDAKELIKVTKIFEDWGKASEFKFDLAAVGGTVGGKAIAAEDVPMPAETTVTATEANKTAVFGTIRYEKAGTYEYTITEQNLNADGVTYDTKPHKVVVTVVKDQKTNELTASALYDVKEDGTGLSKLEITNSYKPLELEGEKALKVNKELKGRAWKEGDSFEFVLSAVSGKVGGKDIDVKDVPMPEAGGEKATATAADKPAVFGKIKYEKAGTYVYKIVETNGKEDGLNYDNNCQEHTVIVEVKNNGGDTNELIATVTYDGKDSLTVINEKTSSNEVDVEVTKSFNKWDLPGVDKFEFTLTPLKGAPMPALTTATATKDDPETEADERIAKFGKIKYEKAGTYQYEIQETDPQIEGVTSDTSKHTVTVTVVKATDATNALTATIKYDNNNDALVITNKYDDASATLQATKAFDSWDNADEFIFDIAAGSHPAGSTIPTPANASVTVNKDATTGVFGEVTFKTAGTYEYTITERNLHADGVTYDSKEHKAIVTVAKNDAGKLVATVKYDGKDSLVITNSYKSLKAKELIKATKEMEDWGNATSFTFKLAAGTATYTDKSTGTSPMPASDEAIATKAKPLAVFGEIEYTKAGTYEYTLTEVNDHVDGVTYDTTAHKVVVTVENKGGDDNKLEATVKYDDNDSLTITNSYKSLKAKELIKATKEMEDWGNATSFTFKLAAGTATYTDKSTGTSPMPASDEAVATKAKPLAVFGEIEYTKAGTYEYTLTEVNDHVDGVTYDTTAHKVVVTVENKGGDDNKLEATVKYDGKDSLTIKNSYKAYETDDLIEVTKDFNDWGKANEFKFDIAAVTENAPMPALTTATATKDDPETEADERIAKFGKIRYEKAGIYEYTITEQNLHADGVTYDTTAHKVVVTVDKDPNTNELSASVKYDDTKPELVIENTYTALDNVELKVSKDFNDWGQAESFTFNLTAVDNAPLPKKDGKVVTTVTVDKDHLTGIFGTVTYEKHGEYRYVIKEVDDGKDGVKYDTAEHNVLVTVVADKDTNALSATVTYDDKTALSVTNVYTSATQNLQVTKDFENWDIADEFKFDIKPVGNAPKPPKTTVTATKTNPTQSFGEITFNKSGTYKYEITEQNGGVGGVSYDTKVHTAVVTVVKGAGPNNALTASVKYDVKEDGTGSDTLLIKNTFESVPTPAPIQVEKIFNAWGDAADSFTFNITDAGNTAAGVAKNPMPEKSQVIVTEDAKTQSFGQITFTKTGDYKYIIREVNDGKDGVAYDTTAHEVVVKVTKTNDATNKLKAEVTYDGKKVDKLTVTNTFTPVTMDAKNPVKVKKDLQGRDWTNDDKFVFDLTAVSGPDGVTVPLPQKDGKAVTTVTATKDNKEPEFGLITFVKSGTYEYKIKEQNSKADGVEYDVSDHSLKIVVEKNKDTNELTISSVLYDTDKKSLTVTNTYTSLPMPTDQLLKVTKELKGRDWLENETFDFTLAAGTAKYTDGTTGTSPMPAGNGNKASATKDAPAVFGQMTFEKTGTYQYTITENEGNKGGITYDTKSYDVTVVIGKVNDNTNALKVDSVTYDSDKDSLTVTNTYKAEGTAEFDAKKILKGRELKAGEFTFELKQDGVKVGEAKNDAEGKVTFEGVKFVIKVDDNGEVIDQTGEYEFTISEVEPTTGKLGGVTYDKTVAKIKVVVTDNHDGTLGITYDGKTKAPTPEFTNYYEAKGDIELEGLKTLEYGDLAEQSFDFVVLDKDGKEVATAKSGSEVTGNPDSKTGTSSKLTFSKIEYVKKYDKEADKLIDETGEHVYTIKEVIPDEAVNKKTGKTYAKSSDKEKAEGIFELGNYRYDTSVKTVKVNVTDDGKGKLTAVVVEGSDKAEFTNTKAYTEVEITKDLKNYVQHKGVKEVTLAFRVVDKETKGSKFSAAGGITFTQAEVESGQTKTVTIAKIPTDIPVEVTEVYASNFKPGDKPSDYTVELKLEDGVYKASFTNTFDDVNYNSGIINKYEKNAEGGYDPKN